MKETNDALMALVKGVVALSEATRELAAMGDPDFAQIASMKAKTAEIAASIARLQPAEACQLGSGEIPEPAATSASYQPSEMDMSLDALFDVD